MHKLKVIHIHTDYKFVNDSNFFEGDLFDNQIIIIQNKEPYNGSFKGKALLLTSKFNDVNKIINICKNANLVVLYDLDIIKCRIALSLSQDVKIAWRFFGYELYGKRVDIFASEKSNLLNQDQIIIKYLKTIYHYLKYKKHKDNPNKLFIKGIKKIDYMLVLSKEEYEFLSKFWPEIPEFIPLPHIFFDKSITLPNVDAKNNNSKPTIIIGNNRSFYNNHLDIIELIEKKSNKTNYNFTILFNYGPVNKYTKAVKKAIENKQYYTLIENFIPPDEFEKFYQNISALVINGYRQMAGANIFLALQNGVKVYLNKRNVFLQWLKNEGFKVYTIEDFVKDLTNNNLKGDKTLAEYNLKQLVEFSGKYTKDDFQKIVYNKIANIKSL